MGRIVALVLCVGAMLIALGCGSKKPAASTAPVTAKSGVLYDRLGGEKAIRAVVDEFVTLASADERVNFTRKGTSKEWKATAENVEKLKVHLTQFITGVTGGPANAYKGKDMYAVHKGMKITNAQFDGAAEDLKAAMDKLKVPEKEQDELMAIVGGTRGAIVQQ